MDKLLSEHSREPATNYENQPFRAGGTMLHRDFHTVKKLDPRDFTVGASVPTASLAPEYMEPLWLSLSGASLAPAAQHRPGHC